jgi:hypothetical protein
MAKLFLFVIFSRNSRFAEKGLKETILSFSNAISGTLRRGTNPSYLTGNTAFPKTGRLNVNSASILYDAESFVKRSFKSSYSSLYTISTGMSTKLSDSFAIERGPADVPEINSLSSTKREYWKRELEKSQH